MKTHQTFAVLAALVGATILSSCTLVATAYPVAGPIAASGVISTAKFTWGGGGSGTITMTLPSGEICTGNYATVVGGVIDPDILAQGGAAVAISTGSAMGLQTSRAMLAGDRGTIIEFEGYTSGANPRHGFGRAKDNRTNVWKIIW